MALTAPPAFVIADATGLTWVDRGGSFIAKPSGSSKAKPSYYVEQDVCGNNAYIRGGHSISISKLVDCAPIPVASLSLKARFSVGTAVLDMDPLLALVADELFVAMAAL